MANDDASSGQTGGQANLNYDDAPERFLKGYADDQFAGASGVLFEQAMAQTRMAICLSDPNLPEHPIVFANRAFRTLTGYEEDEIVGRNCRFLQGPGTDQASVEQIRNALAREEVVVVELLNYRKDGTPFWNALHLGPIYNSEGQLVYYFGSQWDVSDVRAARAEEQHALAMARELSHRMKNMFAVISGIVNVTGRVRGIEDEAAEINARIQALGRAYETTLDDASSGVIDIGSAIRSVMAPYEDGSGQRLSLEGGSVGMPFGLVSIVGLVLHELAANAMKHGAWSLETGRVELDWQLNSEKRELTITWSETGGPKLDPEGIEPGSGSAIVDRLLRADVGTIERDWNESGLRTVLRLNAEEM